MPPVTAIQDLLLSTAQLEAAREAFAADISKGLAREGEAVAAFPAYLPPPPRALQGRARVVDWGGTNIRGALVTLGPRPPQVSHRESQSFRSLALTAAEAFEMQAKLLEPTGREPLPLGYCFSFPAQVLPEGDAVLEYWSKELDIPGVVGQRVGKLLVEALEKRGLSTTGVAVLNDTVASLLGGASTKKENSERTIGLIVGTGFNMAGFFTPAQAPKLEALGWSGPMAVNLEAAQLKPPHLTSFDEQLDRGSKHPGMSRFEKAVSGEYLPYLFEAICPRTPGFEAAAGSKELVRVRESGSAEAKQVAGALLDRSADLVAAGLAAVAQLYGGAEEISVLAEGGLFWKVPGYPERVRRTLDALTRGRQRVSVAPQQEHVNFIGAACASLFRAART